eukprot:1159950-Pelagomonas_calceolata.AAC.8
MGEKFTEVYDYFRAMYKQVTSEDLDNFYVSLVDRRNHGSCATSYESGLFSLALDAYRGSDEERADLLRHYSEFKGDMGKVGYGACAVQCVFEWLMCSDPDLDSHRFMDAIQAAIDAGMCFGLYTSAAIDTGACLGLFPPAPCDAGACLGLFPPAPCDAGACLGLCPPAPCDAGACPGTCLKRTQPFWLVLCSSLKFLPFTCQDVDVSGIWDYMSTQD